MTRQYSDLEYNAVKTAFKLLTANLGGLDAAATCTRVGRSQLADYGAAGSEKFPAADVIMDLERIAGVPHVTAALARAQGFVLVPVESARERGVLAALMAEIGRDFGELFATAALALTHDRLTEKERLDLVRELDNLRRVTVEAMAYLKTSVD